MREIRVMKVDGKRQIYVDVKGLDDIEVYVLAKVLDRVGILQYATARGEHFDPEVLKEAMQFAQRLAARLGYLLSFEEQSRKYEEQEIQQARRRYFILRQRLEEDPTRQPVHTIVGPPNFVNSPLPA